MLGQGFMRNAFATAWLVVVVLAACSGCDGRSTARRAQPRSSADRPSPRALVADVPPIASFESVTLTASGPSHVELDGYVGSNAVTNLARPGCFVRANLVRPGHLLTVRDVDMHVLLDVVARDQVDIELLIRHPDGRLECHTARSDSYERAELDLPPGTYGVWAATYSTSRSAYTLRVDAKPSPRPVPPPVRELDSAFGSFEGTLTATDVPRVPHGRSCGSEIQRQHVFSWIAPATGNYTIDTRGSAMDTILFVRLGDEEGPELGCNDDRGEGETWSELAFRALEGDVVRIFVSRHELDESGEHYALRIRPSDARSRGAGVAVDAAEFGPAGSTRTGTLEAARARFAPRVCTYTGTTVESAPDAPEVLFAFRAPEDGTYHFSTEGSEGFDPILYLRVGSAEGLDIGCDDNFLGQLESQLWSRMAAGDTVHVVLDSVRRAERMNYSLTIERVP